MAVRAKHTRNKCPRALERGRAAREDMLVRILVLSCDRSRTQSDMSTNNDTVTQWNREGTDCRNSYTSTSLLSKVPGAEQGHRRTLGLCTRPGRRF